MTAQQNLRPQTRALFNTLSYHHMRVQRQNFVPGGLFSMHAIQYTHFAIPARHRLKIRHFDREISFDNDFNTFAFSSRISRVYVEMMKLQY